RRRPRARLRLAPERAVPALGGGGRAAAAGTLLLAARAVVRGAFPHLLHRRRAGFRRGRGAAVRAMVLERPGEPLRVVELEPPRPAPGQIRIAVEACGVCRTDVHVRDGELREPKLPLVLGHQIVGRTDDGARVGVPWLAWTCGECVYCRSGRENLCDRA